MQEWLLPYSQTVLALGATAALFLVQLLVADVAGIRAGHRPGTPVDADHGNFLFRATRAHGNINESVAAFVLLALFGVLSGSAPTYVNGFAWLYVAGRAGHMLCYYANLQLARSASFGVSLLGLLGLLATGFSTWL